MKSKGWRIFRLEGEALKPVPFEPKGWNNEYGNHHSKKAAMVVTNGLLEKMPKDTEFVILEVFHRPAKERRP